MVARLRHLSTPKRTRHAGLRASPCELGCHPTSVSARGMSLTQAYANQLLVASPLPFCFVSCHLLQQCWESPRSPSQAFRACAPNPRCIWGTIRAVHVLHMWLRPSEILSVRSRSSSVDHDCTSLCADSIISVSVHAERVFRRVLAPLRLRSNVPTSTYACCLACLKPFLLL